MDKYKVNNPIPNAIVGYCDSKMDKYIGSKLYNKIYMEDIKINPKKIFLDFVN